MKVRLAILVLLAVAVTSWAQAPGFSVRMPMSYAQATLTDDDNALFYALFPTDNATWYLSETVPTKYLSGTSGPWRSLRARVFGDVDLFMQIDNTSGSTDSIFAFIKPLLWNPVSQDFSIPEVDSTHLVFTTAGTYTATDTSVVDFDDGDVYHCLLTGELWPTAGFALYIYQCSDAGVNVVSVALTSSENN